MRCLGVILDYDRQKVTDKTEDFSLVLSQRPFIQQGAEDSQKRPERRLAWAMKCQVPQRILHFRTELSLMTAILQNCERGSIRNFSSFLQIIRTRRHNIAADTGKTLSCLSCCNKCKPKKVNPSIQLDKLET